MTEELIELIKIHTNSEATNRLNTRENANILAKKLTSLIVANPQKKTTVKNCLKFIHHLAAKHTKIQCINHDNASTYLKHLKISTIYEKYEDLYLEPSNICNEINSFYSQQHEVKIVLNKRREFIKQQTQQSLPPDFIYSLSTHDMDVKPFQIEMNTELSKTQPQSEIQRESAVKFVMGVINLKENAFCVIPNILSNISKFDELLVCEKDFLKWLLVNGYTEAKLLIEKFPFLLEEELIEIAIKHIQGTFDIEKDSYKYEWIQRDIEIKKLAFDVSQALFCLAKCDLKLLDVFNKLLY